MHGSEPLSYFRLPIFLLRRILLVRSLFFIRLLVLGFFRFLCAYLSAFCDVGSAAIPVETSAAVASASVFARYVVFGIGLSFMLW